MCVATWEGPEAGTDFVATGSKDHYVKVFEVSSAAGIVSPLLHLEPPHYDGVQALVVANNSLGADAELFSGSRDTGIKRWDLRNGELKQVCYFPIIFYESMKCTTELHLSHVESQQCAQGMGVWHDHLR